VPATKHVHASLVASQVNCPQAMVPGVEHPPAPLHPAGSVSVEPEQAAALHCVPEPGYVQAPLEQAAWHTPEPGQAPREPCGWPELTAVHDPSEPPMSQAEHCDVHVELQQYPSTQAPVWHCELAEHGVPSGEVVTQLPLEQVPTAQSALPPQVVRHAVPPGLQLKLLGQGPVDAAGHAPEPSHDAADVSIEPEQLWVRHDPVG
jgi:hypothetical protein